MLESVAAQADVKDALRSGRPMLRPAPRTRSPRSVTPSASALASRPPSRCGESAPASAVLEDRTGNLAGAFRFRDRRSRVRRSAGEIGGHPRRLNGPLLEVRWCAAGHPIVISDPQTNPRFTPSSSGTRAPRVMWRPRCWHGGETVAMITPTVTPTVSRQIRPSASWAPMPRTRPGHRAGAVDGTTPGGAAGDLGLRRGVQAIADDFTADVMDSAALGPRGARRPGTPRAPIEDRGERLTLRRSGTCCETWPRQRCSDRDRAVRHRRHGEVTRQHPAQARATNRTEAVARYHRMISTPGVSAG